MSAYLFLKFLHIVSSVLLVGTGFGSAYYLFFANRTKSVAVKAEVSRLCVRADWWFTTPAIYETYRRWWEGLGYPAFISMVVVFYLMVTKPALWAN